MPRLPSGPVARLAKLEATRAEIRADETFNLRDMANVAGLTERHFRDVVANDPELPIVQRGAEGVPYIFNGAAVLDHLIQRARAARDLREATSLRASQLAGLGAGGGASPSPPGTGPASPRHMIEDARALRELLDTRARLRAEMVADGRLLDRERTETFLWRWLGDLQAEVLAIEARIDKTGRLDAATREAVKEELGAALLGMRGALERQIGEWDAARHR